VNTKVDGATPLELAAKGGNSIMVAELLKFGANVDEEAYGKANLNEVVKLVLAEHHRA